jgi:hypothetical protein
VTADALLRPSDFNVRGGMMVTICKRMLRAPRRRGRDARIDDRTARLRRTPPPGPAILRETSSASTVPAFPRAQRGAVSSATLRLLALAGLVAVLAGAGYVAFMRYAAAPTAQGASGSAREVAPIVQIASTGPTGELWLAARLFSGEDTLKSGVTWALFVDDPATGKRTPVTTSGWAAPRFTVSPGRYHVVVSFADNRADTDVVVEAGQTTKRLDISLGFGALALAARLMPQSPTLVGGVSWVIYSGQGGTVPPQPVAKSGNAQPRFTLPAGTYRVEASYANTKIETDVAVEADKTTERLDISFGFGELAVAARLMPQAPALGGGVSWAVYNAQSGIDPGPPVATSGNAQMRFMLPAGTYRVEARYADTRTDTLVQVEAGKTTERLDISLGFGELALAARLMPRSPTLGGGVSWAIYQPQTGTETPKPLATSGNAQARFTLPAGSYRAEARYAEARAATDVAVEAGKVTERLDVVLGFGELALGARLTNQSPLLTSGLSWSVFPVQGESMPKPVATSGNAQPRFSLPPGRYRVELRHLAGRLIQDVDVEANTTTERLDLVLGSGELKLGARTTAQSPLLTSGVAWSVYDDGAGPGGPKVVASSNQSSPQFRLPAGQYRVEVRYGQRRAETVVTVVSNKTTERLDVVLATGELRLGARLTAQAPRLTTGITWAVYVVDPSKPKGKPAATSDAALPVFKLPAGLYRVEVRYADATVYFDVMVDPDQIAEKRDVLLGTGDLKVGARLAPQSPVLTGDVSWVVYQVDPWTKKRSIITASGRSDANLSMTAGRYLVEASLTQGKVRAEQELTIEPGKTLERNDFVLNAGYLELSAPVAEHASTSALRWSIYELDSGGHRLMAAFSGRSEARTVLPAGRYQVVLYDRTGSRDLEVVLTAGETTKRVLDLP